MSALVLVLLGGLLLFLGGLRASCSDEGGASQQIEDSAPTEHDRSPPGCDHSQCFSTRFVPALFENTCTSCDVAHSGTKRALCPLPHTTSAWQALRWSHTRRTSLGCVVLSRSPSNTGRDDGAVAFFCSVTRSKANLSALSHSNA